MPKLNQKGVVHLLIPIILVLGIIGTVYLITAGPLKLFPHAASGPISGPVTPVPTPTPIATIRPTATPVPTPIPKPLTLSISPTNITGTGTINLVWVINGNASSCSFTKTLPAGVSATGTWGGTLSGSSVASGSHTNTLNLTTTSNLTQSPVFSITCTIDGVPRGFAGGVTLNPNKPSVTLSANPTIVNNNTSTNLTYTVTGNATNCTLSNSGNPKIVGNWNGLVSGALVSPAPANHAVGIKLTKTTTASQTKTFSVYCSNDSGSSSTASTTITVR